MDVMDIINDFLMLPFLHQVSFLGLGITGSIISMPAIQEALKRRNIKWWHQFVFAYLIILLCITFVFEKTVNIGLFIIVMGGCVLILLGIRYRVRNHVRNTRQ